MRRPLQATLVRAQEDLMLISSGRQRLQLTVCYAGFQFVTALAAIAQQTPVGPATTSTSPPGGSGLVQQVGLGSFFTTRTPYEFWLTALVAITGLTLIWMMLRSIERTSGIRPEDVTRPMIVVTIIMSSLILVIAGFSNEQIAPAFGLFGTIVGYMLGRMSSQPVATPPVQPAPQTAAAPPGTGV
jgi:hypothetical protein